MKQESSILSNLFKIGHIHHQGSSGLMDKVSSSKPWGHGFEPQTGHNHDSSYYHSTDWFQEVDSSMI